MTRLAAIDIGTNTVRLLVADVSGGLLVDVCRLLEITRLGRGVDASRRLAPDAIARTVDAAEAFAGRARDEGAHVIRVVATSAARDARNRHELADEIRGRVRLELEVLDGQDEGRLGFVGATAGMQAGPYLVCDIGGGSTEFIRGSRWMESVWSADVGCVRLRERLLTSEPPTRGEVHGAQTLIRRDLVDVERDVGVVGDETLIGVAGTVTTLAMLHAGHRTYDPGLIHGSRIPAAAVAEWSGRLLSMTTQQVRELPGMHPGRADVLPAGALILTEVLDRWRFAEVVVSEHDILDGIIWDIVLGPEAGTPDAGHLESGLGALTEDHRHDV